MPSSIGYKIGNRYHWMSFATHCFNWPVSINVRLKGLFTNVVRGKCKVIYSSVKMPSLPKVIDPQEIVGRAKGDIVTKMKIQMLMVT